MPCVSTDEWVHFVQSAAEKAHSVKEASEDKKKAAPKKAAEDKKKAAPKKTGDDKKKATPKKVRFAYHQYQSIHACDFPALPALCLL